MLTWSACPGRKKYLDAQKLLLHALTCPSFVANAISAAAYKKFLLLSLILQGQCAMIACPCHCRLGWFLLNTCSCTHCAASHKPPAPGHAARVLPQGKGRGSDAFCNLHSAFDPSAAALAGT